MSLPLNTALARWAATKRVGPVATGAGGLLLGALVWTIGATAQAAPVAKEQIEPMAIETAHTPYQANIVMKCAPTFLIVACGGQRSAVPANHRLDVQYVSCAVTGSVALVVIGGGIYSGAKLGAGFHHALAIYLQSTLGTVRKWVASHSVNMFVPAASLVSLVLATSEVPSTVDCNISGQIATLK